MPSRTLYATKKELKTLESNFSSSMNEFMTVVGENFMRQEKETASIKQRLDNIEERLDKVEQRLDKLEKRLSTVEDKLDLVTELLRNTNYLLRAATDSWVGARRSPK